MLHLGFYSRYYVTILLPVVIAFLCVVINVVHITLFKHDGGWLATWLRVLTWWEKRKWLSVLLLVLFMTYPSLTREAFTMFQCMSDTIGGVHYLELDLSISCDDPEHAVGSLFAWLVIFLFCAGLPCFFTWWLVRHETLIKLGSGKGLFYAGFGFLYQGYRTDYWLYYCWEALTMVRKAAIVLIAAVTKDSYYQTQAAVLVLVFFLGLQLHFAPYIAPLFNRLEALTLFSLVLTQILSIVYFRFSTIKAAADASAAAGIVVGADVNLQGGADSSPLFKKLMNEDTITALLLMINMGTIGLLLFTFFSLRAKNKAARRALQKQDLAPKPPLLQRLIMRYWCACCERVPVLVQQRDVGRGIIVKRQAGFADAWGKESDAAAGGMLKPTGKRGASAGGAKRAAGGGALGMDREDAMARVLGRGNAKVVADTLATKKYRTKSTGPAIPGDEATAILARQAAEQRRLQERPMTARRMLMANAGKRVWGLGERFDALAPTAPRTAFAPTADTGDGDASGTTNPMAAAGAAGPVRAPVLAREQQVEWITGETVVASFYKSPLMLSAEQKAAAAAAMRVKENPFRVAYTPHVPSFKDPAVLAAKAAEQAEADAAKGRRRSRGGRGLLSGSGRAAVPPPTVTALGVAGATGDVDDGFSVANPMLAKRMAAARAAAAEAAAAEAEVASAEAELAALASAGATEPVAAADGGDGGAAVVAADASVNVATDAVAVGASIAEASSAGEDCAAAAGALPATAQEAGAGGDAWAATGYSDSGAAAALSAAGVDGALASQAEVASDGTAMLGAQ
jgi:uncharacterized membrane protein YhaH (DUF805 family)